MHIFYQKHLQTQLSCSNYHLVTKLLQLLQTQQQPCLERLARILPHPIQLESRRRLLQRLFSQKVFNLEQLWLPLIQEWLTTHYHPQETIYLAIDRTQWSQHNIFMVSLIWQKRAIPVSWEILPELGNSNLEQQTQLLTKVIPVFQDYQVILLGDREFCCVELGQWLKEKHIGYCLRLRKNLQVQTEKDQWQSLSHLDIPVGRSEHYADILMRKTSPVAGLNLVIKRPNRCKSNPKPEEWFLLTSLPQVEVAVETYRRRMGIEQMFRDFKSGGYNLEKTGLQGTRLNTLLLLLAITYLQKTIQGELLSQLREKKYLLRSSIEQRKAKRLSHHRLGLDGGLWLETFLT